MLNERRKGGKHDGIDEERGEDEKRTLVIDKTVKGDNKKWYNGKKILKSYVNQGLILVASH